MTAKKLQTLTPKEEQFANLVLTEKSYTAAYIAAGYSVAGMKRITISHEAHKVAAKPHVAARIKELRKTASMEFLGASIGEVMRDWADIATADPNELVQHRRVNCRNCWGKGHKYQWRDKEEFNAELARVNFANANLKKGAKAAMPPTDAGGYGYNKTLPPSPSCPVCHGEGEPDVWFADTGMLTGKAAKLYAGVKVTKDGLQILTHDQDAARANIAKALGMFVDRVKLIGGGKEETPEDAAAKFWADLQKKLPN